MRPIIILFVLLGLTGCSLHRNTADRSPSPSPPAAVSPSPSPSAGPTPTPREGSAAATACEALLSALSSMGKTLGDVRDGKTTMAGAAPALHSAALAIAAAAKQAGPGPVGTSLTKLAADLEAARIAAQNGGDYRTPLGRVVGDATAASAACGDALSTP